MASLRDRVKALEAATKSNATALLDDAATGRLSRWPDVILERYIEGRLDALAATLPTLRTLLRHLEQAGNAICYCGHWHPLFRGSDPIVTERAMARLEAQGADFTAAALATLSTKENIP